MRVCIDVSSLFGGPSGLRKYVEFLIKSLAEVDKENEYILFACFWERLQQRIKEVKIPQQRNFHLLIKRFPQIITYPIEWLLGFPIQEKMLPRSVDIFHGPANMIPNLRKAKSVVTIHQLVGVDFKRVWEKFYFEYLPRRSIIKADAIIADSENTKKDILLLYPFVKEKTVTIYPGLETDYRRIKECPILRKYNLPEKFLLFVGPINKRKNLERTLEAFRILKEKNIPHKLVITAMSKDNYCSSIIEKCKELKLQEEVIFLGFISKHEMMQLYSLSTLLFYPSLYEGFGYPPLEAMACETPVIASNTSSVKEICADAAILIDPYNVKEIADNAFHVIHDENLRNVMIKRGKERVKFFSWEKAAREIIKIYKKLCGN